MCGEILLEKVRAESLLQHLFSVKLEDRLFLKPSLYLMRSFRVTAGVNLELKALHIYMQWLHKSLLLSPVSSTKLPRHPL